MHLLQGGVKVRRVRDRSRKQYPAPPPKKVLPELVGAGGVSAIGTAQQALAQLRESIVITDADLKEPGPKIVYVNEAFTRLTGYLPKEVIGKKSRHSAGTGKPSCSRSKICERISKKGESLRGKDILSIAKTARNFR